jgi:hypothetical protein
MKNESLEELEGALDRVSRRLASESNPVPQAAERVRRLEREPWLALGWTALLIGLSIYTGHFMRVGALLLLVVPSKVRQIRRRRDALGQLDTPGDLLALEIQSLRERHRRLGFVAALGIWIGLLFAGVGAFSPRPLVGLVAGLLLLVLAACVLGWMRPRLRRALAALDAEAEDHWSGSHVFVLTFLFFPVLMLVAGVRSLFGKGSKDDQGGEAEAAGAEKRPGEGQTAGPVGGSTTAASGQPAEGGALDSNPAAPDSGEDRP